MAHQMDLGNFQGFRAGNELWVPAERDAHLDPQLSYRGHFSTLLRGMIDKPPIIVTFFGSKSLRIESNPGLPAHNAFYSKR
jgi:hypothetical protein